MSGVKIDEIDITGLLEEKVTVCILQLKSPFDDGFTIQPVEGDNTLVWNKNELKKRKKKILSLLDLVRAEDYRKDVNIIVLPEYSLHFDMLKDLQNFADSRNVILIGTYYDGRKYIENRENKNFRKNVCSVVLPGRTREEFVKLDKTRFEADFVENPEDNEKRLLRFYWRVKENKLCLQIFICGDFFELYRIDTKHGGIVIVPSCSPKIEKFKLYSNECITPHPETKLVRCVFVCNAVNLPGQQTKLRMIGNSQIFGSYEGKLPILDTDIEGGIIASVNNLNIITKPSISPSKHNIVIENPISFRIVEENGNLKFEDYSTEIVKTAEEKRSDREKDIIRKIKLEQLDSSLISTASPERIFGFYSGESPRPTNPSAWGIIAAKGVVERDQEEEIEQALQENDNFRIICIVAEPGAGKTTLAMRVIYKLSQREEYVFWLKQSDDLNLWRHYGVGKVEFGKPAFN